MAKVLLGVTGSVAALKTPELLDGLRRAGHEVKIVATQAALYFFDPLALDSTQGERNKSLIVLDEDEWPGRAAGQRYQREDEVLHIELRRWADLFLIAPLDANTLAKLAAGLADNCLTCVWRAWDTARPVILAPAMNTLMWQHPLSLRHLYQIAVLAGVQFKEPLPLDDFIAECNRQSLRLRIVAPQSKRLACGDVGVGALAPLEDLVGAVRALLRGGY